MTISRIETINVGKNINGFVYFIQAPSGLVKIGQSKDPGRRLRSLQTGSGEKLTLVGKIQTSRPRQLEIYLHDLFSDDRKSGEWFDLRSSISAWQLNEWISKTEISGFDVWLLVSKENISRMSNALKYGYIPDYLREVEE